jgi:multidrug efflux pump subunit AcrA (membrane-fusion protein)
MDRAYSRRSQRQAPRRTKSASSVTWTPEWNGAAHDGIVATADTIATIEAMKMEASVTAPVAGTVERIAIHGTQQVEGGDLLLVITANHD